MDDHPEGSAESAVRPASRRLALAAFLVLVTSLLVPWWAVTWDDGDAGTVATRDSVRVFRPEPPLTTSWGPHLTGLFAVVAIGLLFVHVAGRTDRHEPARWRRIVGYSAGHTASALVMASLWPAGTPSFWGGRIYAAENVTTQVTETAAPILGWWLAALALLLLGFAALAARAKPAEEPA